jgi:hypothetical protein
LPQLVHRRSGGFHGFLMCLPFHGSGLAVAAQLDPGKLLLGHVFPRLEEDTVVAWVGLAVLVCVAGLAS